MVQNTKKTLLDVTREIIDEGGIAALSMREIGKKAGLSRGAVYRYFSSKEDLLAAIVSDNFKDLTTQICTVITSIPLENQLQTILNRYYSFAANNPEQYRLMFGRAWIKELYPTLNANAWELFEQVDACLSQAQEQGFIVKKPMHQLTPIVYAFIHGLIELHLVGHHEPEKGLNDPNHLINSFLNLIKDGG